MEGGQEGPGRPRHEDPPTVVRFVTTESKKAEGKALAEAEGKSLSSACRAWFELLVDSRKLGKEAEDGR